MEMEDGAAGTGEVADEVVSWRLRLRGGGLMTLPCIDLLLLEAWGI
jgi:hypothetical protein